MNFKVKCTKNVGEEGLTAGKIYEVIDGKITDDHREKDHGVILILIHFMNCATFLIMPTCINFR